MGSGQIDLRLPLEPSSVATARRSVAHILGASLGQTKLEDVQLIVSELVGNSIRHAGQGPDEEVHVLGLLEPRILRLEVKDHGPGFDPDMEHLGDSDTGWGLHILDQLAARWGTTDDRSGVWVEMDLDPSRDLAG